MMFQAVDTGDQVAATKYDRARTLAGKTQALTAFVRPN